MSKADSKRTYQSSVFTIHTAGVRPRHVQHSEDADSNSLPASEDLAASAGQRRKPPAITPEVIQRLIQILKEL